MKRFLDSFDLVHLRPSRAVVRRGTPTGATVHALGRRGREYADLCQRRRGPRSARARPAGGPLPLDVVRPEDRAGREASKTRARRRRGNGRLSKLLRRPGARDPIRQNVVTHALAARAVVLVEGISDQRALEALARRRGRNLDAERVSIVPIGGAQAIGSFLDRFGPQGLTSDWRASVTPARKATTGAVSSAPASAPTSRAQIWSGSVSTCASPTWRTS